MGGGGGWRGAVILQPLRLQFGLNIRGAGPLGPSPQSTPENGISYLVGFSFVCSLVL